ncbi:MAG: hypothetical protein JRC68_01655 [Deltaproteobacteria bacterium]|nr:hypothetical protein [Deltaproteobacteria bacterium]
MREKPGISLIIIASLIIPALFGCLPEIRRDVVGPKPEIATAPLLPADVIDKKIAFLENHLELKKLNDEDREIALNLLSDYKTIRSATRANRVDYDYQGIIHTLFNSLNRLDERYFSKTLTHDAQQQSRVIKEFSLKRRKILDRYMSGDYQGVIADCVELEAAFGPDSLTPEIGLLFAVALAKKDMLNEAVSIGERIVRELEGKPDLIHLRANIIEWQLDMGNREKALRVYEKLIDNLYEKESIFVRAKQKVLGDEEKIAHHEEIPTEDHSTDSTQEPDQLHTLLEQVDRLVKEKEFTKARLLLLRWKLRTEEGPEIETIDQALKTVELAEEIHIKSGSNKNETIEMVVELIEEENFAEAITKLEELNNGPDTDLETEKLKDLAINRLINRERNRAAKIFLIAKQADDPQKREDLLMSSYNILKVLIEKYPSSNLIDKLNNNLENVRDELDKLKKYPG